MNRKEMLEEDRLRPKLEEGMNFFEYHEHWLKEKTKQREERKNEHKRIY